MKWRKARKQTSSSCLTLHWAVLHFKKLV
jgi:hypothetical protein